MGTASETSTGRCQGSSLWLAILVKHSQAKLRCYRVPVSPNHAISTIRSDHHLDQNGFSGASIFSALSGRQGWQSFCVMEVPKYENRCAGIRGISSKCRG